MCGIAGILTLRDGARPPAVEELSRMAGALRHRGPEEFGVYRDELAGLSHARLCIIDLDTGQQPLSNEDGSLWVVFNGEIFNYVEIRRDLEALGHRFRTRSDTEVIVHAWEAWGERAFERFNGQWAVALWNNATRTLVLARDPLGVRPLFVCEHDRRLYFASEIKAIFAVDRTVPRRFDACGLAEVFTFWSALSPRTVFDGVSQVDPGHLLLVHADGRVVDRRYWTPEYPTATNGRFPGSLDEAVEATGAALSRATRLRMLRADVPVGSYLSGGLDSSLVASMGLESCGGRFFTFSLRFEDAEYDETPFQRVMARALGSEHREVVVSRRDIARVFPDVVAHTECPILRTAPAPLFLLSRLVHDAGIKVVLTGEGADEMFAGYDLFREAKVRRFWAQQPDSARRSRLLERLYPYMARSPVAKQRMARQFFGQRLSEWASPGFGHGPRWRSTAALRRMFSPQLCRTAGAYDAVANLLGSLPPRFGEWPYLAQDQYLEVRTLLAGYILSSQGDRMLMAHSVEGRFPFLDKDVVALANSLPPSFKLRVLDEKHVVKRVARRVVPPEILTRKKQPYRAPDALSFVGPDAPEWVPDLMSERALSDAGVFAPETARQLYHKCAARSGEGQLSNADNMALVGVVSTGLLYESFVRRQPQAQAPARIGTLVDRTSKGLK